MMLPVTTAHQMAIIVSSLAQDFWDAREAFKGRETPLLLSYRINIEVVDEDPQETLYVHYVLDLRHPIDMRWYYTISEVPPYAIDHALLRFRYLDNESENLHFPERGGSWRHYAFHDLLHKAIVMGIESIAKRISTREDAPLLLTLWNTFPMETFNGTVVSFLDKNGAPVVVKTIDT